MNSKSTWIWFITAVSLFALIFALQRFLWSTVTEPSYILPDLHPNAVTSIQVIPANAFEIRAVRTNNSWLLIKPIVYPAQPAAIEALLAALQKLTPATRLNAGELRRHKNADAEYGFDPPKISLVIATGDQRWQLQVGRKTAPGDQVFLRVVGVDGVFVADTDWLKFIPHSADEWRDTSLVNLNNNNPDWIILTNGTKVIELRLDPTNHLWRMTRPLMARADSGRITEALQNLRNARVSQFVTDDPTVDLSTFGLQPADLDLWLGNGTNFSTAIHIGKSSTNNASRVYAKREGWNAIVTTAKEPLSLWRGTVNDFRDPYLLDLSAPITEIKVEGRNNFTLEKQGTNGWSEPGEKFPVDTGSVQQFIKLLANLRIAEFVKDVVTKPDLPAYGLAAPERKITLFSAGEDGTNAVVAQLLFGATQTNEVFVRRADEDFIYAVSLEDFNRLPEASWEFRKRRIWNFSENDVAQITIRQDGKTRQIIHNGPDRWSFAPGSQGIINPPAIEETTHRLGELTAEGWVARNMTNAIPYGFKPGNLQITLILKNGTKKTVDFGMKVPAAHTALAAVTLDGERWAFVFSPVLYQFVLSYLTIPANVP